jgi:hypothetical protein
MYEVALETNNLEIWVPAIVSIITLVLNLLFYIFIQPRLTYKATAKESLKKVSVDLLNYLAEIISYEQFDGVPTQIRKYSLQIHLHFKAGTSDGQLEILLEQIFNEVRKRKNLTSTDDIDKWNDEFRVLARNLRKKLAKHCGVL